MATDKVFRFKAVDRSGQKITDVVSASDRSQALRRLESEGLVVTDIAPDARRGSEPGGRVRANDQERTIVLRQMAILMRARVDLLDALETVASGMSSKVSAGLQAASLALRRGEPLSAALRKGLPDLPDYVFALVELGQATGRLDGVFEDAARQMEFEDRMKRDMSTALTYPGFLVVAGLGAVTFLFYEVVPRFAAMVGDRRNSLEGLPALILNLGELVHDQFIFVAAGVAGLAALTVALFSSKSGKRGLHQLGYSLPVVGGVLRSRDRATWSRIMAFALGNGVGLLRASELALEAAPQGPFRRGLETSVMAIRQGKTVDDALAAPGVLEAIDLSLLRAGQKSGNLGDMLTYIAERYDQSLQQSLKRATLLIEPLAIGFVAIAVGAVAIGLVSAMSSVYESVS